MTDQGDEAGPVAAERWRSPVARVERRVDGPPLDPSLSVTVHFHPDRLVGDVPLLAHLLADGVYRSQFETGTSNGGLTAFAGGDRWRWEHRMFDGWYDDAPVDRRPKYGSLNHRRLDVGGSVRFGSAHLRLRTHVLPRTTFCYPDSSAEPTRFGTAARMGLITRVDGDLDVLDDHIEAHVHGPLSLGRDVEAIMLDPSYRTTDVEAAARTFTGRTEWHRGFRLHVETLAAHEAYRGAEVVRAGTQIAQDGWLTPRIIGRAARAGVHDWQILKRVWHCTARFGYDWPVETHR